jgi:hypothetical protein
VDVLVGSEPVDRENLAVVPPELRDSQEPVNLDGVEQWAGDLDLDDEVGGTVVLEADLPPAEKVRRMLDVKGAVGFLAAIEAGFLPARGSGRTAGQGQSPRESEDEGIDSAGQDFVAERGAREFESSLQVAEAGKGGVATRGGDFLVNLPGRARKEHTLLALAGR